MTKKEATIWNKAYYRGYRDGMNLSVNIINRKKEELKPLFDEHEKLDGSQSISGEDEELVQEATHKKFSSVRRV